MVSVKATPLEIVLGRLVTLGLEPKPVGDGWSVRCPASEHGPGHVEEMLSIHEDADGRLVVECDGEKAEAEKRARLRLVPKDGA